MDEEYEEKTFRNNSNSIIFCFVSNAITLRKTTWFFFYLRVFFSEQKQWNEWKIINKEWYFLCFSFSHTTDHSTHYLLHLLLSADLSLLYSSYFIIDSFNPSSNVTVQVYNVVSYYISSSFLNNHAFDFSSDSSNCTRIYEFSCSFQLQIGWNT